MEHYYLKIYCFILAASIILTYTACSPLYVLRAGWEEAGILLNREKISSLINDKSIDDETKRKLQLVLDAREFAKTISLEPGDSFTQYSKIDRDVLVWVLSASEQTSFRLETWWFPIVGHMPYKGYFDKKDALKAGERLKRKGKDILIRPSSAFSTLGWFNDPLLSTTLQHDDITLVDTVIHEILHNTVWIKNHAHFNESLANFVGSQGSYQFFLNRDGKDSKLVQETAKRWQEELRFARFLEETRLALNEIYNVNHEQQIEKSAILQARMNLFSSAKERWNSTKLAIVEASTSSIYDRVVSELNNAIILAYEVYLKKPEEFVKLFELCNRSMKQFIEEIKQIKLKVSLNNSDPYSELKTRIDQLNLTN